MYACEYTQKKKKRLNVIENFLKNRYAAKMVKWFLNCTSNLDFVSRFYRLKILLRKRLQLNRHFSFNRLCLSLCFVIVRDGFSNYFYKHFIKRRYINLNRHYMKLYLKRIKFLVFLSMRRRHFPKVRSNFVVRCFGFTMFCRITSKKVS